VGYANPHVPLAYAATSSCAPRIVTAPGARAARGDAGQLPSPAPGVRTPGLGGADRPLTDHEARPPCGPDVLRLCSSCMWAEAKPHADRGRPLSRCPADAASPSSPARRAYSTMDSGRLRGDAGRREAGRVAGSNSSSSSSILERVGAIERASANSCAYTWRSAAAGEGAGAGARGWPTRCTQGTQ